MVSSTGQWRAYAEADEVAARPVVLIVEDDAAAAKVVARMLEDEGWDPRVATTWSEAMRQFGDDIDLVIMDAVMPTVDGFKLTNLMRGKARSYVPILMLTALSDERSKEHAMSIGVDDILPKPANPFELRLRVRALLRIRRLTSELEAKTREAEELARRDPLTGVANRRSLDERLRIELARTQRYKRSLSLVIFDIDHFKQVNDEHGHGVGDRLLAFFGKTLLESIRPCDLACRFGGEEFVVLAPDTPAGRAVVLAERVRRDFLARTPQVTIAGKQSLSAGVSGTDLLRVDDPTGDRLLHTADLALYEAKRLGRNRVCCFAPSMGSGLRTGSTERVAAQK